jgi:hypothetical protein
MIDAVLTLVTTSGRRNVLLSSYLDASAEERAHEQAIAWIKGLRHAEVEGLPLRRRFTYRGDSLWWFAEIYLHKQQAIRSLYRAMFALEQLVAHEQPGSIELERADRIARLLAPQIARARGVNFVGRAQAALDWPVRLTAMDVRARWLHTTALASRFRSRRPGVPPARPTVAAFIHRAFWRDDAGDGPAEAYIGPVLQALERRIGADRLAYVSVGPGENFSARRWWHPLRGDDRSSSAWPVEAFAPVDRLCGSLSVWAERHRNRRALCASPALRESALINGWDCWPVVREELAGVALLQWPWSARAMDEAGAALDALRPATALTYAEAGGWGRALMLECRRRGIPSAGLQHGFIYRHWLNYLHEHDEMLPEPGNAGDPGFPRPDTTVLFDDYARQHLAASGNFPGDSLVVAGSPRLDALVNAARSLDAATIDRARADAHATSGVLVLMVTKYREARSILPALLDAVAELPGVRVAIKSHPAETADVYDEVAAGRSQVTVLPPSAPLAPLIRASRAVVTVNSTVALDAAVLDVPALVIGLPNNLSPFVEAGVMAGAARGDIRTALERILYDEKFRQQLEAVRRVFLARFRILSDGSAAERSAEIVLKLADTRALSNSAVE